MPDLCDHPGAMILSARIKAYWKERGYEVSVRLDAAGFTPALRGARTDVRSDMVNGSPWQAAKDARHG